MNDPNIQIQHSETKAKILVVEDEIIVAVNLGQKLKKLGYELVGITSSGEEAIQKALENPPDLVLMDINIEGSIDGIETAEVLVKEHNTPVIYLTAYADATTLDRAKKTSPLGYIVKPFETDQLRSSIEMALYKDKMERKVRENEQKLLSTLNNIGSGVITTDESQNILFMNPSAEELSGYAYQDILGKQISEVFHLHTLSGEEMECPAKKVFESGKSWQSKGEVLFTCADASQKKVLVDVHPLKANSNGTVGSIFIVRKMEDSSGATELSAERETYLKEIHHRIKNNLNIISSLFTINSSKLGAKDSLEIFRQSQNRIHAVALLHEILYESSNLSTISFDLYIRKLTDALFQIYSLDRERIRLKLNISESQIPSDLGMNCGLIINELVTNSIKHAFPKQSDTGTIEIQFRKEDQEYVLSVNDDGIGMSDEILETRSRNSLGLSLVQSLAKQLGGTLRIGHQNGTQIQIRFPFLK